MQHVIFPTSNLGFHPKLLLENVSSLLEQYVDYLSTYHVNITICTLLSWFEDLKCVFFRIIVLLVLEY